uniref:Uncharacterized protein n=1 Tax=Anguilla anguilla TaxID=7936 RepID=A0A0E9QLX5_ANGAN
MFSVKTKQIQNEKLSLKQAQLKLEYFLVNY